MVHCRGEFDARAVLRAGQGIALRGEVVSAHGTGRTAEGVPLIGRSYAYEALYREQKASRNMLKTSSIASSATRLILLLLALTKR